MRYRLAHGHASMTPRPRGLRSLPANGGWRRRNPILCRPSFVRSFVRSLVRVLPCFSGATSAACLVRVLHALFVCYMPCSCATYATARLHAVDLLIFSLRATVGAFGSSGEGRGLTGGRLHVPPPAASAGCAVVLG